jgi:hypothetical protein
MAGCRLSALDSDPNVAVIKRQIQEDSLKGPDESCLYLSNYICELGFKMIKAGFLDRSAKIAFSRPLSYHRSFQFIRRIS